MTSVLLLASFLLVLAAAGLWFRRYYVLRRRRKMEEQVEEARVALLELQEMIKTPGWKRLQKIADTQIEGRRNEVLLQPTTDAYAQEYMKGEINGMATVIKMPAMLVEQNKELLEIARKLDEEGAS